MEHDATHVHLHAVCTGARDPPIRRARISRCMNCALCSDPGVSQPENRHLRAAQLAFLTSKDRTTRNSCIQSPKPRYKSRVVRHFPVRNASCATSRCMNGKLCDICLYELPLVQHFVVRIARCARPLPRMQCPSARRHATRRRAPRSQTPRRTRPIPASSCAPQAHDQTLTDPPSSCPDPRAGRSRR